MVLEKILEHSLDCKEIKPVNPKGNQSWLFIGRTDVEAPILWPPDVKSRLIGKDPDAGKDWKQEEKGTTENEMIGWHHWFNGHEFAQTPGDSESMMPSSYLILCRPVLLLCSIFLGIKVFFNVSDLHLSWQSIGASASVLPMSIQGWFPFGLTGLTCLISFNTSNNPIRFKIQGPVVELGFQFGFFLL